MSRPECDTPTCHSGVSASSRRPDGSVKLWCESCAPVEAVVTR